MSNRNALGRGLSALIPGAQVNEAPQKPKGKVLSTLPLIQIRPASSQPRTQFDDAALIDLAASIKANGIIQPIVVRAIGPESYSIIAGERRFRAAKRAGLKEIPAVIREVTDAQAFELALIENIQREDLDPIEEGEAYRHLIQEHGLTQDKIAQRVGKNRTTIANALRLLKLPEDLQEMVSAGDISAGHGRALLSLPDQIQQERFAQRAHEEGWSVRELERRARALRDKEEEEEEDRDDADPSPLDEPLTPNVPSSADQAVESQLRAALGAPVRLSHKGGRGRIEIRFHSLDELERLIDLLTDLEGR